MVRLRGGAARCDGVTVRHRASLLLMVKSSPISPPYLPYISPISPEVRASLLLMMKSSIRVVSLQPMPAHALRTMQG